MLEPDPGSEREARTHTQPPPLFKPCCCCFSAVSDQNHIKNVASNGRAEEFWHIESGSAVESGSNYEEMMVCVWGGGHSHTPGTGSHALLGCCDLIERQMERVRWRVRPSFISGPVAAVAARAGC